MKSAPSQSNRIVVEARVAAPVARVWEYWVTPEQIVRWNAASDNWHTTSATNDLRVGGAFSSRMEAKDGSFGFDFAGTYTEIEPHSLIAYRLGEGAEACEDRDPSIRLRGSELLASRAKGPRRIQPGP